MIEKREEDKLTEWLHIRVSPKMKKQVEDYAIAQRRDASDTARLMLDAQMGNPLPPGMNFKEDEPI